VPTHYFESMKSLIVDAEMFPNLVNVIEKTFKIPLL